MSLQIMLDKEKNRGSVIDSSPETPKGKTTNSAGFDYAAELAFQAAKEGNLENFKKALKSAIVFCLREEGEK